MDVPVTMDDISAAIETANEEFRSRGYTAPAFVTLDDHEFATRLWWRKYQNTWQLVVEFVMGNKTPLHRAPLAIRIKASELLTELDDACRIAFTAQQESIARAIRRYRGA